MKNDTGMSEPQRRWRWGLLYLLGASLAACGGSGREAAPAAAPATAAALAKSVASALTTYCVVNLDPANSSIDPLINANNQVAFTGQRGPHYRAGFFNGDTIRAIGTFGGNDSYALALNDAGQVAVAATNAGGIMSAFRWTETGGLVRLDPLSTTVETRATGVSGGGQITGFSSRLSQTCRDKWPVSPTFPAISAPMRYRGRAQGGWSTSAPWAATIRTRSASTGSARWSAGRNRMPPT